MPLITYALDLLQSALSASHVVAWQWELASGACQRSGPCVEELGIAADASHEAFLRRVHAEDHSQLEQALLRTRDQLEPYVAEFRITLPSGEERWLEARGGPLLDAHGNCVAILGSMQNITGRKRLEQRLLDAERECSQQAQLLRQVHDLVLLEPAAQTKRQSVVQNLRQQLLEQVLSDNDTQMAVLHGRALDGDGLMVQLVLAPLLQSAVRQALVQAIAPLCAQVLSTGQRQLITRDMRPGLEHGDLHAVLSRCRIGGVLCTPLLSRHGQLTGTLTTLWWGAFARNADQLRVLDIIALKLAEAQSASLPSTSAAVGNSAPDTQTPLLAELTPQQQRVAQLLKQGQSNRTIAQELQIAENTVKAHVATVLRRLGLHSRVQLIMLQQPDIGTRRKPVITTANDANQDQDQDQELDGG